MKATSQVPAALGGNVNTWIVIFCDGPGGRRWWHWLFKPGFRHCFALGWDGRCWLQVDGLSNILDVRSFADVEMRVVMALLREAGAAAIAVDRRVVSRGIFRGPLYCVPTVKHLLGVRACALTPWQLYRALRRRGGRPVDLGEWT